MKTRIVLALALISLSTTVLAGRPNGAVFVTESIPAVSQPGLIALAFVIGLAGAHLIRKVRARQH